MISKISIFLHVLGNSEQRFETIFSLETISIESV